MTSPVPSPAPHHEARLAAPPPAPTAPDLPPVCPVPSHTSGPHHAALSGHTPITPGAAGFHCGASSQGRWGPNDESEGRRWVDRASEDGGGGRGKGTEAEAAQTRGAGGRNRRCRGPRRPRAGGEQRAEVGGSGPALRGRPRPSRSVTGTQHLPRHGGIPETCPLPPRSLTPTPAWKSRAIPASGRAGSAPGGSQQAHPPEPGPGPFKMTSPGPRVLRGRGGLERGRAWWDQDVLC